MAVRRNKSPAALVRDPIGLGFRRIWAVRVWTGGGPPRYEIDGVVHRLPVTRSVTAAWQRVWSPPVSRSWFAGLLLRRVSKRSAPEMGYVVHAEQGPPNSHTSGSGHGLESNGPAPARRVADHARQSSAYGPPAATSAWWVPSSTTLP